MLSCHSPVPVCLGEAAEDADQVEAGDGEDVVRAVDLVVLRVSAWVKERHEVRTREEESNTLM